ncbi:MAG: nodulation protein NfeD, partial [Blastopirellula sp. JB062]
FVTAETYETMKREGEVAKSEKIVSAGELAIFTGRDLRLKYQLISHLAESRQQLAQQLEVPDVDLQLDYSLERDWKATRVELTGGITNNQVQQLMRMIQSEVSDKANLILLEINSPGGDPVAVESLMNYLLRLPNEVRTVAFVKNQASSNAALIPFACDEIAVSSEAILGGTGAYQYSAQGAEDVRNFLIQVGEKKERRWSAWAAMCDPQLEVANYRHQQSGLTALFCPEELQQQIAPDQWERIDVITVAGQPLELSGGQAFDWHLADAIAADSGDIALRYGVAGEISTPVRTWAHQLIDALAHPGLAWFFLFIGISALIMEMQAPGIGIFGFMSAVCFGFYFWSQFLSGTAGWLEVLLFVGGVGFVLIEIFVLPGFGIFGLGGGAMILGSVVLASQTFIWPQTDYQLAQVPYSIANIFIVMAAIGASLMFAKHIVPHVPFLRDTMLQPPDEDLAEELNRREMIVDLSHLVGESGVAQSQLVPGGKAKFGRELVNVTCETGFAPRGAELVAVSARGNYLIVRPK